MSKKPILDEKRVRNEGEFFTPDNIVDLAHDYISEALGENWKEEYVVYDPACGHCNLTRNYKFTELYCSTLLQSDVDIILENKYNPEATIFQFDFLNDSIDSLPQGLKDALSGDKKLLVLMNPPYGTSASGGVNKASKTGIAFTTVRDNMNKEKWSGGDNLYTQFIYQVHNITKSKPSGTVVLCPIVKAGMLTTERFKAFRQQFFKRFSLLKGFTFGSGHFSGTASTWSAMFSIFPNIPKEVLSGWEYTIIQPGEDNTLIVDGIKRYYNLDNGELYLSKWVKTGAPSSSTIVSPELTCFYNVKDREV